jgi:hypothetical protein
VPLLLTCAPCLSTVHLFGCRSKQDIDLLEGTFTRWLFERCRIGQVDYDERLAILGLERLERRRFCADLILMFKLEMGIELEPNRTFRTEPYFFKQKCRTEPNRTEAVKTSNRTERTLYANIVEPNELEPSSISSIIVRIFYLYLYLFCITLVSRL